MDASMLLELFESLPEVQALLQCAHRLGVAIGLRGGVVRNTLLTEGAESSRYDSLYDFVDPFGDINLVVTDDIRQTVLSRALLAEVPFADCHFWDSYQQFGYTPNCNSIESIYAALYHDKSLICLAAVRVVAQRSSGDSRVCAPALDVLSVQAAGLHHRFVNLQKCNQEVFSKKIHG